MFSTYSRDVRDISSANSLGDQKIWTSHGNVVDLKLQLQIQEFINSQKISRIRFTGLKRRTHPQELSIFSTVMTVGTITGNPAGMSIVQTRPRYRLSANAVKGLKMASGKGRSR